MNGRRSEKYVSEQKQPPPKNNNKQTNKKPLKTRKNHLSIRHSGI